MSAAQKTMLHFPMVQNIGPYDFQLPGLGQSGPFCQHHRLSHFSEDGSKARFSLLHCKQIVCPKCWADWARRAVFALALRIEVHALETGQRPYRCVFSVAPEKTEAWDWEGVNRRLFQRGYRRGSKVGIVGGVSVFHPYRLKPSVKRQMRGSGVHAEVGMWDVVRREVRGGASLFKFARLGPHVHAVVFGSPKAHADKEFLLAFSDEDGRAKPLEGVRDVVGFMFYLLTHTGVLTHDVLYGDEVRRRKTHTIRSFGSMFRYSPELRVPPADYNRLASEIADALGMVWDASAGELRYPASCRETGTSEASTRWLPLWELGRAVNNEAWLSGLSWAQQQFWLKVLDFVRKNDRPPDLSEITLPSGSAGVEAYLEKIPGVPDAEQPAARYREFVAIGGAG